MCGNGIRCVAKYAYDYGIVNKEHISVATKSGIKYLDLTVENGKVSQVKVNMGSPILTARQIPVVSEKEEVINEPLDVNGKIYYITAVPWEIPTLLFIWMILTIWILKRSARLSRIMLHFRIV